VSCLTLDIIDQNVLATLKPQSMVPTWAAQAVHAVTLEGPAGITTLVGDCSGVTVPTVGDLGSISGTVVDAVTGDPIFSATVWAVAVGQTLTDASGQFSFPTVTPGMVELVTTAGGYEDGSDTVTVLPGLNTDLTIELTPEIESIGTINGTVIDAVTAAPLVGALVRLDFSPGPAVSATTGADGSYNMFIPEIPDFFALTASLAGYIPESANVQRSSLEGTTATIDFALDPTNPGVVVIETVPDVHHLGDDNFSGAANSQFQKSAEGTEYSANFSLTADQLPPAYNNAEVRMLAKGFDYSNTIEINGTTLGTALMGTPSDGSYGEWSASFDIALLVSGNNKLTVSSAFEGDYDDFEFVNVQIWLSP
jgi:hypothetical protein